MIELLLQRDKVDLNAKDRNGQSPLSWQREGGHDAVVKLLLLRKDVDTYSWDKLPYNTTILGDKGTPRDGYRAATGRGKCFLISAEMVLVFFMLFTRGL